MKRNFSLIVILFLFLLLAACNGAKLPMTLGDPRGAQTFGYQPLDPLPVSVDLTKKGTNDSRTTNQIIMDLLPDETTRLAIGQSDISGNISYGPAKVGYKGHTYNVVLDYIKFDTKSLEIIYTLTDDVNKKNKNKIFKVYKKLSDIPAAESLYIHKAIMPVYVGIGLRLSASVDVKKGSMDLGNLFGVGMAAEAEKISGTLVVQTLGISGENISSFVPLPNQINETTIQNALLALGSIKAKMYEADVQLTPRIVGIYNNIGGGSTVVNAVITEILDNTMINTLSIN